jgi:hypothetical protein
MNLARPAALLCVPLLALGASACASTSSVSSFKGENHAVAQTISDLQTYGTAGEAQKICSVLSRPVTARLDLAQGGCKQALKTQLSQVDTPEVTVEKVQVHGTTSATAEVKSTYAGKAKLTTVTLVKEDGAWKISQLG